MAIFGCVYLLDCHSRSKHHLILNWNQNEEHFFISMINKMINEIENRWKNNFCKVLPLRIMVGHTQTYTSYSFVQECTHIHTYICEFLIHSDAIQGNTYNAAYCHCVHLEHFVWTNGTAIFFYQWKILDNEFSSLSLHSSSLCLLQTFALSLSPSLSLAF